MIEFKFNCPGCGQHIMANDAYSGRQINCPTCQAIIIVPTAPGAPPPTMAASAVPHAPPAVTMTGAHAAPMAQRPGVPPQRPAAPAKKSNTKWLIIGGAAAAIVVAGITFAAISYFGHSDTSLPSPTVKKTGLTSRDEARSDGGGGTGGAKMSGPGAAEIVQKVEDSYAALTSYSADGDAAMEVDMSKVNAKNIPGAAGMSAEDKKMLSKPVKTESTFTVKMARPSLYRVEWTLNGPQGMAMKGAAWSAGDGDYLLTDPSRYVKMDNRDLALGMAAGVSGGAAATMPMLFFGDQASQLTEFKSAKRAKDQAVDGDDCYVLKGNIMGMQTTVWVVKDTYFIKQKEVVFGGKQSTPDMSDAQIDKQLDKMGTMSDADKAKAKAAAKQMKPMMSQMKGKMTETYHNIVTNKSLDKSEFKYDLPPGAKLAKSLY